MTPNPLALLLVLFLPDVPSDPIANETARPVARVEQVARTARESARPEAQVTPVARTAGPGPVRTITPGPVREALRQGGYPWYDSETDRVRGVWPTRMSWIKWLGDRMQKVLDAISRFLSRLRFRSLPGFGIRGDMLGMTLLLTALATFFVFLVVLWLRSERGAGSGAGARQGGPGTAALLAQLPDGLRSWTGDAWAEANRRRQAGDYAGAVVCLFAHQLLALDQMGLIRLAPGWTGRHYVRWLTDPVLLDSLRATLGLFEDVYYGRRLPTAAAFESVWSRAQAFQQRQGELGAAR